MQVRSGHENTTGHVGVVLGKSQRYSTSWHREAECCVTSDGARGHSGPPSSKRTYGKGRQHNEAEVL